MSSDACSVCGRTGYRTCTEFEVDPGSCSAYRSELCNACDDDGDGAVDEGLAGAPCTLANGCSGVTVCSPSGASCVWAPGSSKPCDTCGEGGRAACGQTGTIGPCQPVTASRELACNGCDDDRDCVGDGMPGAPELCNGIDDDCDGSIDESHQGVEGDACQVDVASVCCEPTTCAARGKNCGSIPDGCGQTLNCGTCTGGQSCGGGGTPNVCGCTPLTREAACTGRCGTVSNGCTGTYDCGGCSSPQSCGGGGAPNVCGCTPTPKANACAGKNCGSMPNGCGGAHDCGSCSGFNTCGGGGTPNVCGCTPDFSGCDGFECGPVSNSCGGTISCGTCTGGAYCRLGVCTGGSGGWENP